MNATEAVGHAADAQQHMDAVSHAIHAGHDRDDIAFHAYSRHRRTRDQAIVEAWKLAMMVEEIAAAVGCPAMSVRWAIDGARHDPRLPCSVQNCTIPRPSQ